MSIEVQFSWDNQRRDVILKRCDKTSCAGKFCRHSLVHDLRVECMSGCIHGDATCQILAVVPLDTLRKVIEEACRRCASSNDWLSSSELEKLCAQCEIVNPLRDVIAEVAYDEEDEKGDDEHDE